MHIEVIEAVLSYVKDNSLSICGLTYSPVKGPEGNIEYLCYMKNNLDPDADIDIRAVVEAAHSELDK